MHDLELPLQTGKFLLSVSGDAAWRFSKWDDLSHLIKFCNIKNLFATLRNLPSSSRVTGETRAASSHFRSLCEGTLSFAMSMAYSIS